MLPHPSNYCYIQEEQLERHLYDNEISFQEREKEEKGREREREREGASG